MCYLLGTQKLVEVIYSLTTITSIVINIKAQYYHNKNYCNTLNRDDNSQHEIIKNGHILLSYMYLSFYTI